MPKKQATAWQATSLTFRNGWCHSGNCSETKFSAMMKRRFCRLKTGRFPELEAKLATFFIEIRNLILPVTSETVTQASLLWKSGYAGQTSKPPGLGHQNLSRGFVLCPLPMRGRTFLFRGKQAFLSFIAFCFSLTPRGLRSVPSPSRYFFTRPAHDLLSQ